MSADAREGNFPIVVDSLLRRSTAQERRAVCRLLGARATAVFAGAPGRGWRAAIGRARPDARFLFPSDAESRDLDSFLAEAGVSHVHLLHAGAQMLLAALRGAERTLSHARIDVISSAGPLMVEEAVAERLDRHGYEMLAPGLGKLAVRRDHERPARLFAIHQRLLPLVLGGAKRMLDLDALCRQHRIIPRGIVHVGAYEGEEAQTYRQMGLDPILFVEANPAVFERLAARLDGQPGVILACCAVTDRAGTATLHVTSWDQSSSILPLGMHRQYYPEVVEERTITVPAKTLDGLFAELEAGPERFNLLNIDIQGAELAALRGGETLLRNIEGINVEVNFEELYRGCCQIEELDRFLGERGFRRVATASPFHPSWGDAFYARR